MGTVDPVFQPWQSPYCSMDGNPVSLNDPMGLSTDGENDSRKKMAYKKEDKASVGAQKKIDGIEYELTEEINEESGEISKVWVEKKPVSPSKIKKKETVPDEYRLDSRDDPKKDNWKSVKAGYWVDSEKSEIRFNNYSDRDKIVIKDQKGRVLFKFNGQTKSGKTRNRHIRKVIPILISDSLLLKNGQ